ncbi:MAG: transporter substrate-binding domain-containing protein [Acidobacteria bacterium]|nr:transporter substrate-binding domain-containing protein [Acidobacteriota bacterium]
MEMKRILLLIALLVLAAGGAGICRGQAGRAMERGPKPASAERGEAGKRRVRFGVYENRPKIYTDDAGRGAGIFGEVLEAIAEREGWNLVAVGCDWDRCLEQLREGRIDLMPDVAISDEREREFDFHREEVLSSWSTLYARKGARIRSIPDLDGRRIAVLSGSVQKTALERLLKGFGFQAAFIEADSFGEAYGLASRGDADAVASNQYFGDYYHGRYQLEKTPIVFHPVSLYYAARAGAGGDLLEAIDRNLRRMKAEPRSAYYRALERWMERPPRVVVPRYIPWVLGGIAALLAAALSLLLLFRRQLRTRTRHLAESNEKLRDSEAKFRDLFHNHSAVKLLIDPADGAIVEANRAAERFYGWTGARLCGMRIGEISTLSPDRIREEMDKARDRERMHFESRHRLADGSVRDVAVFGSGIEIQGRMLLHAIVHDITERRRLESHLRQAQKMEAVGRLAGGVAHDYNNMLGVIVGYAEMGMEQVEPGGPLEECFGEILKAAGHSAEITRQLLAFARVQPMSPKSLDLDGAVEASLNMLRRLIGEQIRLEWVPAGGLWPVRIDPGQLNQVLVNLCVNARDAIADVGRIVIETENAVVDQTFAAGHEGMTAGEYVLMSVSDDGCGMDAETLEHLFEPFFSTKEVGRGTGLGLATVYGIVKQNGGYVHVQSEKGKGTTLRVYLPRHAAAPDTQPAGEPVETPAGRGETLLLVEDDASVRRMTRRMLEKLGYRVLEAASPAEATATADAHVGAIDLAITDMVMPGMNGRDLARALRARHPGLKVLFMSGHSADAVPGAPAAPPSPFLQKPFSMKDLAAGVHQALAGPEGAWTV